MVRVCVGSCAMTTSQSSTCLLYTSPTAAGQVRTAHVPREQRVAAEQQTAAQQADGPGAVAGRGDDAEREIRVHADLLSCLLYTSRCV